MSATAPADAAPKTMIDTYGSANGFGWKVNDIIGAQVVSVPIAVPIQRANYAFKMFPGLAGGDFHLHHHHAQRDAVLVRHPARQAPVEARRRGEPRAISTQATFEPAATTRSAC